MADLRPLSRFFASDMMAAVQQCELLGLVSIRERRRRDSQLPVALYGKLRRDP